MRIVTVVIAAVVLAASVAPARAASEPPVGAASCSGCHPVGAGVDTPVPRLAGRKAAEIETQMQAFRTGQTPATVMHRIANGFTESEVAAIAAWYAAQQ
jgi:cytochrome c553